MDLAENHLIRFISISRKKDGMFINFRVKGIKGGTQFSTSITVDLAATELDATASLEEIIEQSGRIAAKEFRKSEMQFEGVAAV